MNLMVAAGCIVASALFQLFVFFAALHYGNRAAISVIILCAALTYLMYFMQLAANGTDGQMKANIQAVMMALNAGAMVAGFLAYIVLFWGG